MLRLYAKELVLSNFAGYDPDQMLERLIELSLNLHGGTPPLASPEAPRSKSKRILDERPFRV